jgi:hypothetical protein
MAWPLFVGGAARLGVVAYEGAFTAFSSKQAVVAMGTYTVASEAYSATTGRSMSRDAYVKTTEAVNRATASVRSIGDDAKRFESSADFVVKMM